jgi:hypothetical protein
MNGLGSALLFSQFLACHVFYSAEPDAVDAVPADAKQDAAASFCKGMTGLEGFCDDFERDVLGDTWMEAKGNGKIAIAGETSNPNNRRLQLEGQGNEVVSVSRLAKAGGLAGVNLRLDLAFDVAINNFNNGFTAASVQCGDDLLLTMTFNSQGIVVTIDGGTQKLSFGARTSTITLALAADQLSVNDQRRTVAITCTGDPVLTLGILSTGVGPQTIFFDDVIFTARAAT